MGSPFGADQLGWEVIKHLQNDLRRQPGKQDNISLLSLDRPGTVLLEKMQGADKVILIDALAGTLKPGQVMKLTIDDIENTGTSISSHSMGLRETLMLGKSLNTLPEIIILGVDFGEQRDALVDTEIISRVASRVMDEISSVWIENQ
ncbi:MAG: hydrogenase maturation protease [Gammaproteobacteria bacterium]|nr:hydrogenase maturation protease [Gammaproteobacteria bacterium]